MKAHDTKVVKAALQLRTALVRWQKLHPEDSDTQACSKARRLLASKKGTRATPDVSKQQQAQISKIRRAVFEGDMPPFQQRLFEVLQESDQVGVSLEHILDSMKKKGWAPASKSDQNARTYICAVAGKDNRIVRVERGTYRLRSKYYK